MQPDATHIAKLLAKAGVAVDIEDGGLVGPVLRVAAEAAPRALRALRDCERGFAFLVDLFGIDTGEAVDVVYHVRSFAFDEEIVLKSAHAYGGVLASVWESHHAALMPERECAEMFGLSLAGHPNPKHLLLTPGIEPPLLKATLIRGPEEVRNR